MGYGFWGGYNNCWGHNSYSFKSYSEKSYNWKGYDWQGCSWKSNDWKGYSSTGYEAKGYSWNSKYCGYQSSFSKPAEKTYEISAFQAADLISGNLGCGSKFTMPGSATVTLTVSDDDKKMSGDHCDKATDKTGQTAAIEANGQEIGNGGQVYVEAYHILKDAHGRKYILVEMEQEGSGSDYFTFYTGGCYKIPAAGTDLTLVRSVNSPSLCYDDLGAGAVTAANIGPEARNDAGEVSEDATLTIDVLENDSDADGDDLVITMVEGQAIAEGETVTLANGVEVTLIGNELVVDGTNSSEVQDLAAGHEYTVSFDYKISDGQGGTDTALVDVTFNGVADDLTFDLPTGEIRYLITDENNPAGTSTEAYTVKLLDTGVPCLDGLSIEKAYCLDIRLDDGSPEVDLDGTMAAADDFTFASKKGIAADEMDNVVNYMLNNDWDAEGYTDAEVQGAIWGLFNNNFFVTSGAGESDDARDIFNDAKANGRDFEVSAGDLVGVVVTPNDASYQPFIVGLEYADCIV